MIELLDYVEIKKKKLLLAGFLRCLCDNCVFSGLCWSICIFNELLKLTELSSLKLECYFFKENFSRKFLLYITPNSYFFFLIVRDCLDCKDHYITLSLCLYSLIWGCFVTSKHACKLRSLGHTQIFLDSESKPPIGQVEMGPETGGALIFIYWSKTTSREALSNKAQG